jgi:pyruvate,orthophosphate dikinase
VPAEGWSRSWCEAYKAVYKNYVGKKPFPQNPMEQLELAIEAVFKSWNAPRAISYRRINEITGLNGTGVNVQTMVFGNMGDECGTGVAFTRNPSTGENKFYGEFLINAQGEDVVAGIRTPQPCDEMPKWDRAAYKQLLDIKDILEKHYKDMQDIEFTIEHGHLYMLQTRTGKRTGAAAVKMAVDMVKERLITKEEALLRIPPKTSPSSCCPASTPAQEESPGADAGFARLTGCGGGAPGLHRGRSRRTLPAMASRYFWSVTRRAPRTSTACTPPWASSRAPAG